MELRIDSPIFSLEVAEKARPKSIDYSSLTITEHIDVEMCSYLAMHELDR